MLYMVGRGMLYMVVGQSEWGVCIVNWPLALCDVVTWRVFQCTIMIGGLISLIRCTYMYMHMYSVHAYDCMIKHTKDRLTCNDVEPYYLYMYTCTMYMQ